MKNIKFKNFFKKIAFIGIFIYVVYTFFAQQKTLNIYQADQNRYSKQIIEEKEKQKELNQTKIDITSNEYIEEIAREKLNMYLPNEKVYIDINN